MSNPVPIEAQFYTTSQVATLFSVTAETVRDWIERGTLEAIRTPGGKFRITVESVKALANSKYAG